MAGSLVSVTWLAAMSLYGFSLPADLKPLTPEPAPVYAQTPQLAALLQPSYERSVGKLTAINDDSYIVLQELFDRKTEQMARLIVKNTDLNRESITDAVEDNYVYQMQCLNGNNRFGNRNTNQGGKAVLTIWDKKGERLLGYNEVALEALNPINGCVRLKRWYEGNLIFEIADLRLAHLQVHYYTYDLKEGSLNLRYGYESHAQANGNLMYIWFDQDRNNALVQIKQKEQVTNLFRVPFIELETVIKSPSRLNRYALALKTSQEISVSLLDDEHLAASPKGLVVPAEGGEKTLVPWTLVPEPKPISEPGITITFTEKKPEPPRDIEK